MQIANMKGKIEDNLEYLDGYEELPEDLQEQVRRAMEQGHVDDEDWNGVSSDHCCIAATFLISHRI